MNGRFMKKARATRTMVLCVLSILVGSIASIRAEAAETLVIAASPSVRGAVQRLSEGFEQTHPGVRVRLYFDNGLDLRRTVAGMENSLMGQYFIGTGPIHLIAPGGDELIARLEQKHYVLPGTARSYAQDQLVLVVPESLVEAPESLEAFSRGSGRLAVAEADTTTLGRQTLEALRGAGLASSFEGRIDEAADSRGVVDHVLVGEADAGIVYGHEALKDQQRLRVVATIEDGYTPTTHSMAMERYCPNRALCTEFLAYIQSPEGHARVREAGYAVPRSQASQVKHRR